jgi:hypothetical protein
MEKEKDQKKKGPKGPRGRAQRWGRGGIERAADVSTEDLLRAAELWEKYAPREFRGLLRAQKEGKGE